MSTAANDTDLRYKIDTSLRGDGAEVESRIRDLFPGRLATYGMVIVEVVATIVLIIVISVLCHAMMIIIMVVIVLCIVSIIVINSA